MIFPVKDMKEKIENQKVVQDFLEDLTDNSYQEYLIVLAEFCKVNNKTPIELLEIAKKEKDNNISVWDSSLKKWLQKYETHSEEYNRSVETYKYRLNVIKGFFTDNQIDIPKERHKKRKKRKQKFKVKNKRKGLTKELIREVVENSKWLREKAMILTQVSSGLAVADLVQLTLKDYKKGLQNIGGNKQICLLHFKEGRSKTGEVYGIEFYTFINFEGVEAIERYIKNERNPDYKTKYLFTNMLRDQGVSDDSFQEDLRRTNRRMNINADKHLFNPITSHMFRKFFNTQLTNAGMPSEARKHLMGHVISGIEANYYLTHPDDLMKLYIEFMPSLLIFEYESVNIRTTDEEVKEMKEQMKQQDIEHQNELKTIKEEIEALKRHREEEKMLEKEKLEKN